MADVVYLHVGSPKTGTTYIQDRLALNRAQLARHDVRYPLGVRGDMFHAALDLIERPWGGMLPDAKGEWDALVKRTRRAGGRVVISHEILAGATGEQVERAMASLAPAAPGAGPPRPRRRRHRTPRSTPATSRRPPRPTRSSPAAG